MQKANKFGNMSTLQGKAYSLRNPQEGAPQRLLLRIPYETLNWVARAMDDPGSCGKRRRKSGVVVEPARFPKYAPLSSSRLVFRDSTKTGKDQISDEMNCVGLTGTG